MIGVPLRDFGEDVVAFVVPSYKNLDTAVISRSLTGRIAKFKQPKAIVLADALPRNTMGKVQKAELRRSHADLFV